MNIYKITNNVNGKIYIGKTERNIKIRWQQHCKDAKNPLKRFKLQEDILEFGKDCFTVEIIDKAETEEDANEKEIYWIQYYDCRYPKGYNVSKGGNNGGSFKRVKNITTGEEFESMSEACRTYHRKIHALEQALDKPHRTCAGCHWITIT